MSEDDPIEVPTEIQIDSALFSSPLQGMLTEFHEIYEGLEIAGFPHKASAEIIAHMIADAISYRQGYQDLDEEDDDEEDEDFDDDGDSV